MLDVPRLSVPFVDLQPPNDAVKRRVLDELCELIDTGAFSNGPQVAEFERAFAMFAGAAHCVGVASGLDALRLGLLAAGAGAGDRVVVPALTFIATFEAVTQVGAQPVPVDVSEHDWELDSAGAEVQFAAGATFGIPVHLYGQLCDMRALAAAAARHGVTLVEDACQAHGASRDGVRPGELSAAAAYSFYPAKNLGAFGDAGALVTDDPDLATRVKALRQHGEVAKYRSVAPGWTARLDTFQALVLRAKLDGLAAANERRRRAAEWYESRLRDVDGLALPPCARGSEHVWHLYVVRTEDPDGLAEFLHARHIATARHYPEPPHLSQAYRSLGFERGAFPVAEAIAAECLSLPMFGSIEEDQVAAVADAIREYFGVG
ncbi:MAG: DegT/DnrJ/EryC1/StrS family aminotransferase [Solirubrobacteraceae bacterium]